MIIILDNIRSVHNVGSIFRTSDAVEIEKIYLCGITPAPIDRFGLKNKALAKVALGAENSVTWKQEKYILDVIKKLKKQDYKILAVEQNKKSISLFDFKTNKKERYAVIMGAEVDGISKDALKLADEIIEIPMSGKKESLNVSVAFGVIVYVLTEGMKK